MATVGWRRQSFPGGRDRPEGIAKKDWEIRGPPDAPRVYFMSTFDDTGQGPGRDPSSGEVGVLLCWHCPFNRTSTCLGAIPTAFSHDEAEVSDNTPREHVYIMGESNIKAALSPLAWVCGKEPAYEGRMLTKCVPPLHFLPRDLLVPFVRSSSLFSCYFLNFGVPAGKHLRICHDSDVTKESWAIELSSAP